MLELEGHAFGNLLLAALTATTGDFVSAVAEAAVFSTPSGRCGQRRRSCRSLCSTQDSQLEGQVKIMGTEGIRRVCWSLDDITPAAALMAVAEAQMIVIGPGSLYTSVLAALAPSALVEAILHSLHVRCISPISASRFPRRRDTTSVPHCGLIEHGVTPDVVLADTTSRPWDRFLIMWTGRRTLTGSQRRGARRDVARGCPGGVTVAIRCNRPSQSSICNSLTCILWRAIQQR